MTADPPPAIAAEALLRRWIGLDPGTVGHAAIRRAVRKRMGALGLNDVDAYARLAESEPLERDLLVEEVVVAESWFFRDPQVYGFVRRFICDRVAVRERLPVRVLSVPCAAGEEPYSLAISLLDAGVDPAAFVIDASDISRAAIDRAIAGRYTTNAFRTSDLGFRDRWFRTEQGVAVLDPVVRESVRFAWGNLLDESFTSSALAAGRAPYDVVFCRNLLIYLTSAARADVERALDALLKPDGLLVLGAAEPPIMKGNWVPAGEGAVFALRRGSPTLPPQLRTIPRRPPVSEPRSTIGTAATRTGTEPQAAAAIAAPAPPPAAPFTQPALQLTLRRANELANERRFAEAIEVCVDYQRTAGPASEVYFLMGMVHQSAADLDAAEDCFHKTLYLDAGHAEACLALALLAGQRGDARLAELYRRAAARVVARRGNG